MVIEEKDKQKLDKLYEEFKRQKFHNIGYPENADFDYNEIERFMEFSINNVGDPFNYSNYPLNSLEFEKEVIAFFSELYKINPVESWGYVTNGGTEGNMYGIYLGREIYPEAKLYFSEDAHYSVKKIARILKVPYVIVASQENGEIDYEDLKKKLENNNKNPAIIFSTLGTTMKGAVDDVTKIREVLSKAGIEKYYIHCDAALSGAILPFLNNPQPHTFEDGIDSICLSGHKFLGSPIPSGIIITKKEYICKVSKVIDYIASLDTTINGSRNGITPLVLWYAIKNLGYEGMKKRSELCLKKAEYAENLFRKEGIEAWRNKNSITVVFPKPSEEVWKKWCLANSEKWAHIITSSHVSYEKIDEIVFDISRDLKNKPNF